MTTRDKLRQGDRLKIAAHLKPRGLTCYGGENGDSYISYGEVGIVTRTPYIAHDGTSMAHWSIEFSRGRRAGVLTVPEGVSYAESDYACFLLESQAEDWRRV